MATIGLLTGTFDPIHRAHVALARAALRSGRLDAVWLLVNPHLQAGASTKLGVAALEHRRAMIRLALAGEEDLMLYEGAFQDHPHRLATFSALMDEAPEHQFVFIVGMDVLERLDQWEDWPQVVQRAAFMVAERPDGAERSGEGLDGLTRRLGVWGGRLRVELLEWQGHGAVSSRLIRSRLKERDRPGELDARVWAYIVSQGIY